MIHPRWFLCPDCGADNGEWCPGGENGDETGLHARRIDVAAKDPRNIQVSEALTRPDPKAT